MAIQPTDSAVQSVLQAQKAAAAAEKDAEDRIAVARRRAQEAEQEASSRLDQIHDHYARESDAERVRQEAAMESARSKGYQNLRNTQQSYNRELARAENQGKTQLQERESLYNNALYEKEKKGTASLRDLETKQSTLLEQQHQRGNEELLAAKTEHQARMERLRGDNERFFDAERETSHSLREQMSESQAKNLEQTRERHQKQYGDSLRQSRAQIDSLHQRAGEQLRSLRDDATRKLTAYASRNEDPFYQLLDLGGRIKETDDAFILTARIPEHERQHLSVSVRGNQVILAGHRRNDDSQELGPGQSRRTASFQSYSESFPLSQPVEARAVEKRFEGELLIVELPKKHTYSRELFQPKASPGRLRADRPRFPENLPIHETGEAPHKSEDPAEASLQAGSGGSSKAGGRPLG